jgi:transposase
VDPHKGTHTAAAVDGRTGESLSELTVRARDEGHERLLAWAVGVALERTWALEDCRHVSGRLERFLIGRGERVVRVPPKLMAGARRSARERGKSDAIDALAVARAALREPGLPAARLEGRALEIRLLLDHREDLVAERTRIQNRLRWHLHDLDPGLELPSGALSKLCWLDRLGRRLGRLEQGPRTRIARELVVRSRELTRKERALERELAALVKLEAPQLLALPGCGPLTAAKLIGEVADVERVSSDAQLAMHAGAAPLDVSSGKQQRHRLNRSGNRQLNLAPAPCRPDPEPDAPPGEDLSRSPPGRGQDPQGGHEGAQAPPRPDRLPHPQTPLQAHQPPPDNPNQHGTIGALLDIGATDVAADVQV